MHTFTLGNSFYMLLLKHLATRVVKYKEMNISNVLLFFVKHSVSMLDAWTYKIVYYKAVKTHNILKTPYPHKV